MTSGEFDCLIVLGSALGDKAVTRDLLVGGKGDSTLEAVRNALEKSSEPSLQLQVRYDMGLAQLNFLMIGFCKQPSRNPGFQTLRPRKFCSLSQADHAYCQEDII